MGSGSSAESRGDYTQHAPQPGPDVNKHGSDNNGRQSQKENNTSRKRKAGGEAPSEKRPRKDDVSDEEGQASESDADSDADMNAFMAENGVEAAQVDSTECDSDDDLDSITQDVEAEFEVRDETGLDLNASVVKMVQKLVQTTVPEDTMKTKLEKIKKPGNCEFLAAPKLNKEVARVVMRQVNWRDVKAKKLQINTVKAITLLAETVHNVREKSLGKNAQPVEAKTLIKDLFGVIGLLGSAFLDANQLRKDMIRPELPVKYKPLCSSQQEVTEKLFGDDLAKAMKDMNQTSCLSRDLTRKSPYKGQSRAGGKGKAFSGHSHWQGRQWNPNHSYKYQKYNRPSHQRKQEGAKTARST